MSDTKRRLPVKTRLMALDGEYAGWEFMACVNPRISAFADIASGEFARITQGLTFIIRGWNFVDEEGEDMPPPSKETIGMLPLDLVTAISSKFVAELSSLPPK